MKTLTTEILERSLLDVGVGTGDRVMVHSSLAALGRPDPGPEVILDVLRRVVGPNGALAVPAFTFSFCRGEGFDSEASPSEGMGVLAELVRRHPEARRTRHAIQSLAVIGPVAEALARIETASAYAADSAFARLPALGFKLLLLGASPRSVSMVHLCEEQASVPYRTWKRFGGMARFGGRSEYRTFTMYARDRELDADVNETRIRDRLASTDAWRETRLHYGRVASCALSDYVSVGGAMLARDPLALLDNRDRVAAMLAERRSRSSHAAHWGDLA